MIQQAIRNLLRGNFCGGIGGFAAGLTFGAAMTIYSTFLYGHRIDSLYDLVLPYLPGLSIVGAIGGCLLGGFVGMAITLAKPHLLLISQIVGSIAAAFVSLFMLNSDLSELWIAVIIGSALLAGVLGGTTAFRAYIWLYEPP